jgi:hypothetical protein
VDILKEFEAINAPKEKRGNVGFWSAIFVSFKPHSRFNRFTF